MKAWKKRKVINIQNEYNGLKTKEANRYNTINKRKTNINIILLIIFFIISIISNLIIFIFYNKEKSKNKKLLINKFEIDSKNNSKINGPFLPPKNDDKPIQNIQKFIITNQI